MLLATMQPDENGVVDIQSFTTYAGGQIPRDRHGDLAFSAVVGEPVEHTREIYEMVCMMLTGALPSETAS